MPSLIDRRVFAAGIVAGAFASPCAFAQRRSEEELIEQRESRYNTIYVTRQGPYIAMKFGVNRNLFTESLYNPRDPRELPVVYTRYMTVAAAYPTQVSRILEIGLGGGRTAQYLHLHMPQARITCVELDREVIALAQRHFGVRPDQRLQVVESDGRMFLRRSPDRYDLIMIDAYRGTFVPFHLLTREFFMAVKRKLTPGGVAAQNIEPSTMLFDPAVATLKSVFQNVDLYPASGNTVAIAYDGPPKTTAQLRARATTLQRAYNFRHNLPALLSVRRVVGNVRARVLTDDFAPVESLRAIEKHNRRGN